MLPKCLLALSKLVELLPMAMSTSRNDDMLMARSTALENPVRARQVLAKQWTTVANVKLLIDHIVSASRLGCRWVIRH